MTAFYNENDPFAAAWLRELIAGGHIAPGVVDERSIEDIAPVELMAFTQCHFFAGIGVWSYSLRRAGWPDDRPIWTGSCPCQPFSTAGKGGGFADERHLWPSWHWLIEQCGPGEVLGEQVGSSDADVWIDLVQSDLEGLGFAFGDIPFASAGVGAPIGRDRNFWVARANGGRRKDQNAQPARKQPDDVGGSRAGELGSAPGARPQGEPHRSNHVPGAGGPPAQRTSSQPVRRLEAGPLGSANGNRRDATIARDERPEAGEGREYRNEPLGSGGNSRPGPVNGFWRTADWLACRDGKWRPVEPGTFPLAHGAPARVGRLRGYGNAINAEAAQAFIEAYLTTTEGTDHV